MIRVVGEREKESQNPFNKPVGSGSPAGTSGSAVPFRG